MPVGVARWFINRDFYRGGAYRLLIKTLSNMKNTDLI